VSSDQDKPADPAAVDEGADEADESSASDRRQEPRVSVDLWIRQEYGHDVSYTHTADISTGGIQFDHGFPHPVGTEVELRFALPGEQHEFKVAAEVVGSGLRRERPVTHLRFLKMTVDEYVLLTRFVRGQLEPGEQARQDRPAGEPEQEEP
jgi:hypothetical protein